MAITSKAEEIGLSYCTGVVLVPYLFSVTMKFDLLLKNFIYGCYLVMVATRQAQLSSDNSYNQMMQFHIQAKCIQMYLSINGHVYDSGQCLFTKIILNEILV